MLLLPYSCEEKRNALLDMGAKNSYVVRLIWRGQGAPTDIAAGDGINGSAEKGRSYVADEEIRLIFFYWGPGDPKIWHVAEQ